MKHIAKRSLSMLLALVMLCSLCVNALAADEVKVNSALSATELEKSASAQTVRVTVAPASAVTVSNYEVKLEVPKGWTITKIENDDPNATLTASDYNLTNGQMGWTSADTEDKSVSKFVTYTVEIPANTAAGKYELKVVGVMADKNYGQDAVLTKGQHDSTLTLTVKEKTCHRLHRRAVHVVHPARGGPDPDPARLHHQQRGVRDHLERRHRQDQVRSQVRVLL